MLKMRPNFSVIRPVILCGGMGSRLHPLSTTERPKPFLHLFSDYSMFQETLLRVRNAKPPMILCNQDHVNMVGHDLLELEMQTDVIIQEPVSRNTAPAAALAARYYCERSPNEILLFLPSDHVIENVPAFHNAMLKAIPVAKKGHFVLFGEKPTEPDTGYGYIKSCPDSHHIKFFHEKPPADIAERYIKQGCYWNTGIIMVSARTLGTAFQRLTPQLWIDVMSLSLPCPEKARFERFNDISIDYAILEKVENRKILPISMGWTDIGTMDRLKALA